MLKIETERLRFRQWTESDFEEFANYFADENLSKYVGGVKNREASWRLMATYIGHYQLKGFSYPAVVEKSTGKLVGSVGLWKSGPWPEIELGYWLMGDMQGKGYGTEAGLAVKAFAFDTLKLETLVSYIDAENNASSSLAKRLGGELDGVIDLLEFGPHEVYRYHNL